jgi:manganese transport protein
MVLQALAVRLGVASSRDLAQACREHYPKWVARCLWVAAECAIAATDMAEVIGTAVALNILFGLPLYAGVIITAADVLLLLAVAGRSARGLELFIVSLLAVICGCFIFTLALATPPAKEVMSGFLPRERIFTNSDELYLAAGIIGATVMPHNLYLHSALVQSRGFAKDPAGRREAISYAIVDSTTSLVIAGFVNASMLIVAAAAFFKTVGEVASLNDAASLLAPALGSRAASTVFAVGLLAAGQQSTLTGTLAGQVVMEGFLGPAVSLKPWARRLATRLVAIVPAVAVAAAGGERGASRLLTLSQVILSLQLPFAIFPLVQFTGSAAVVGEDFVTRKPLRAFAWLIFLVISALNCKLVVDFAMGGTDGA